MGADQWREAKALFTRLRDATPAEREGVLGTLTEDDPVREAAERLLRSLESAVGFLEEPAGGGPGARVGGSRRVSPADHRALPKAIGPYEPIAILGEGGFGVVYRARQYTPVEREVAVKVLRAGLDSPQVLARFTDERRYLARLDHPDIVRVLDAGRTEDGRLFVAMDLAPGVPITAFVKAHELSVRERVVLMARVCRAVHSVHQRAIVHRDLKPSNILVAMGEEGPRPRIIDFGIAAALDDTDRAGWTRVGAPMGTPRYASPEQALGRGSVDTRADIYSLGMVLGEVLAGKPPRGPAGATETAPTPPSRAAAEANNAGHARQLRGDLDRVVLKAIAWDAALRYDSAASLADDLDRYLEGRPVLAVPPGRVYLARKFVGRHRVATLFASAAVVSLAAGLGVSIGATREAQTQRDQAETNANRVALIGRFLLDTISNNADPDEADGGIALNRDDLSELARQALEGVPDDPDIMLGLLSQIGQIQNKVGNNDDASATFASAVEQALRIDGGPSPRSVLFRIMLFDAMASDHANRAAADEVIDTAYTEALAVFEPDDPRLLSVQLRMPITTEELERIIAVFEANPVASPTDHITALYKLYYRYEFSPRPARTLPVARRRYELLLAMNGPGHSTTLEAQLTYGAAESVHGSPEFAYRLLSDAYTKLLTLLGPTHHSTDGARRTLLRIYAGMGRAAEGIALGLEGERIAREVHGEGSVQHATALQWLGVLYAEAGDPHTALDLLTRSLAAKEQHWPEGHNERSAVEVRLAMVLADLGRFDEARVFADRALATMRPGAMPVPIAMAVCAKARALDAAGDRAAAEAVIAQARADLVANGGGHAVNRAVEMLDGFRFGS